MVDATAPVTETNPYPKPKRLRLRRCGAVLRVPTATGRAEVVYTCSREKHGTDAHREEGYVFMDNGTARKYEVLWTDEGVNALRVQARKRKVGK